ncbi:MAG TPA: hypothetical protein VIW24_31430 [Aldersonia sp.]
MTDPSKVLLLADDEVVAIAALLGVPWPTPFTVAGHIDREVVEAMVQRGTTSLLVRELATAATGTVELGGVVHSYLDPMLTGAHVTMFHCTADAPDKALGGIVHMHRGDEGVIVEAVAAGGLRQLSRQPADGWWSMVSRLARAVFDDGVAERPEGVALCLLLPDGPAARITMLAKGRIDAGTFTADDGYIVTDSTPLWSDDVLEEWTR